jgi:hypothetical protein
MKYIHSKTKQQAEQQELGVSVGSSKSWLAAPMAIAAKTDSNKIINK